MKKSIIRNLFIIVVASAVIGLCAAFALFRSPKNSVLAKYEQAGNFQRESTEDVRNTNVNKEALTTKSMADNSQYKPSNDSHTASKAYESHLEDIDLEPLRPAVQVVAPPKRDLSFEKPEKALSESDRETAKKYVLRLITNMEKIESLEFDVTITDSENAIVDMTGHISSTKRDTFTFNGSVLGNTVEARIDCTDDFAILRIEGNQSLQNSDLGAFELLQNVWMTPLTKVEAIDLFDTVSENQKFRDKNGNEIVCTVFSGPQFKWVFDPSSGRLLQTEAKHPSQNSITRLIYDKEEMYPHRMVISFPDGDNDPNNDRTIKIQHDNLKVTYRKEE